MPKVSAAETACAMRRSIPDTVTTLKGPETRAPSYKHLKAVTSKQVQALNGIWVQAPRAAPSRSPCLFRRATLARAPLLGTCNPSTKWNVKAMQVGDIVVLKSGSQEMTIEAVRADGRLLCVWTDFRMKVSRSVFPAATLRLMQRSR